MTDKIEGLLPCPFCGRAPSIIPDTSYGEARVMCFDDCPVQPIASAELADGETVEGAIAAWNTRQSTPVGDAGLRERIAVAVFNYQVSVGLDHEAASEDAAGLADAILAALQYQPWAVTGDAREVLTASQRDFGLPATTHNVEDRAALRAIQSVLDREAGLRAALIVYGRHAAECDGKDECSCGLSAALSPVPIEAGEVEHADTLRLDWLDQVNTNANERNGTRYGWKYDINHNRAALTDHNWPPLSIREAIDAAMSRSKK